MKIQKNILTDFFLIFIQKIFLHGVKKMKRETYENMIENAMQGDVDAIQNLAKWCAYRVVRQVYGVSGNEYIRKLLQGENKSVCMEDLISVATIALIECFRANYMVSAQWLNEPIFRPVVKHNKQRFMLFENAIKYAFWCIRKEISASGIDNSNGIYIESLETLNDNGIEIPVLISGKQFEKQENEKAEKIIADNIGKLTKQQVKILKYKLQGLSNRQIAKILNVANQTVGNELRRCTIIFKYSV